ncbi:O-antigen ligase family protein [Plasticicumulans sp.]|uniref:O-antigen ligase family protein n=1 Tax=Plasticicumulans sp. TaxID=2307179 RepID=UPI003220556B
MSAMNRLRPALAVIFDAHGRWGRAALGLFALASLWLTAPANLGLGLALLAAGGALFAGWRRGGRPDAVGFATLALLVWLVLRYGLQLAGIAEPELVKPQSGWLDWMTPLVFATLAVLIPPGCRLPWLRRLWALALLGCTLGVIGFLIGRGPLVLWSGERLGFHLNRPLGIGLYAGVFVVGLVAARQQWWSLAPPWRWPLRIGGLMLLALHLQVLASAQNRTTWLALLVVAAGAGLAGLWRRRKGSARPAPRRTGLAVLGAVLLLAVFGYANRQAFEQRLEAEQEVVATVGEAGLAAASASSITTRLRLWQFVLERWPQAPLLGHGFGGLQTVVDTQLRPRAALMAGEAYDHVHNSYLQALWTQGAIGILLWALLVGLLLRDVQRAARVDPRVRAWLPAVWGALGFVAVWACFDYRLSHPDMRFFSILLLLGLRLLGTAGSDAQEVA